MILQVATRLAYGTALVKIGKNNSRVVAMDGDTKNSTFAIKFKVWPQYSALPVSSFCVKNPTKILHFTQQLGMSGTHFGDATETKLMNRTSSRVVQ